MSTPVHTPASSPDNTPIRPTVLPTFSAAFPMLRSMANSRRLQSSSANNRSIHNALSSCFRPWTQPDAPMAYEDLHPLSQLVRDVVPETDVGDNNQVEFVLVPDSPYSSPTPMVTLVSTTTFVDENVSTTDPIPFAPPVVSSVFRPWISDVVAATTMAANTPPEPELEPIETPAVVLKVITLELQSPIIDHGYADWVAARHNSATRTPTPSIVETVEIIEPVESPVPVSSSATQVTPSLQSAALSQYMDDTTSPINLSPIRQLASNRRDITQDDVDEMQSVVSDTSDLIFSNQITEQPIPERQTRATFSRKAKQVPKPQPNPQPMYVPYHATISDTNITMAVVNNMAQRAQNRALMAVTRSRAPRQQPTAQTDDTSSSTNSSTSSLSLPRIGKNFTFIYMHYIPLFTQTNFSELFSFIRNY